MSYLDVGLLILRLVVGLLFMGHGAQKLFGWFGGHGMQGHTGNMEKMGMRPAPFWAYMSALAEFVGGLFLALGFLTPLAAAMIIASMLVAIAKVHAPKGLWNTQGGYEYNLVLLAVAFFIGLVGPGLYSLDSALDVALPEPETLIIVLIVALLGVIVALLLPDLSRPRTRRRT